MGPFRPVRSKNTPAITAYRHSAAKENKMKIFKIVTLKLSGLCFICVLCIWQMLMSVSKMLPSVVLIPTAQTQWDLTFAPASLVIG